MRLVCAPVKLLGSCARFGRSGSSCRPSCDTTNCSAAGALHFGCRAQMGSVADRTVDVSADVRR